MLKARGAVALWMLAGGLALAQPSKSPAAGPARAQVALLNAQVEADRIEVLRDGARLTGRVKVHAEQLGAQKLVVDADCDRALLVTGRTKEGNASLTKLVATGRVHLVATTTAAKGGQTRRYEADCDRAEYVGQDEVIHLFPVKGQPVVVHITETTPPTPENKLTAPREYKLDLTARETLDLFLSDVPVEPLGAGAAAGAD